MDLQIFSSATGIGPLQIMLSVILCVYGVKHLLKYRFAKYYRLSGTERMDKLILAVADFSLSTVNILLLFIFKA